MTISKRRKRTAKKLILPLIVVGLMTLMMYAGRPQQPAQSYRYKAPAGAAARTSHDLHMR